MTEVGIAICGVLLCFVLIGLASVASSIDALRRTIELNSYRTYTPPSYDYRPFVGSGISQGAYAALKHDPWPKGAEVTKPLRQSLALDTLDDM